MRIPLHVLLECLAEKMGHPALVKAVKDAVDRQRNEKQPDMSREKFLNWHGLRSLFLDAIKGNQVQDFRKLAQFMRQLDITPEMIFSVQTRLAPWDSWRPGSVVAIVVGGKLVDIPQANGHLMQRAVGAADAEAVTSLEKILREKVGIDCKTELHFVPPDLTPAKAQKYLDRLGKRKNVGAIVVLGSPRVNPLADPIAMLMFSGVNPADLPALFRWSFDLELQHHFLTDPEVYASELEGIAMKGDRRTMLKRIRDEVIIERMQSRKRQYYEDCGILAMYTQHEPMLILCAGHGGDGTKAAVLGLSNLHYIQRRLLGSVESIDPVVHGGRIFEPVWVLRQKPTRDLIDDLYFDKRYGKGWAFFLDLEAEESQEE
ncbi:MAG: hypothetical protein V3T77_05395 [Planctomycetota bacterium]